MSNEITTQFSLSQFITQEIGELVEQLKSGHLYCMNEPASKEQVEAWKSSLKILKREIQLFLVDNSDAGKCSLILENELPRERGRRPDVLLLLNSSVIVIECKGRPKIENCYLDQVSAYSRDLKNYHEHSHDLNFGSVLLLTSVNNISTYENGVNCLSGDRLNNFLNDFWNKEKSKNKIIDYPKWADGDYHPLPSLIQAARNIFRHEPLPSIRRAESAGIPQTMKMLKDIATSARENKEHHLVMITGVPGAGKTLVGISFVYENLSKDLLSKEGVFLSGNGPLVEVLKYALKSSVFVQDVHGFLKQYGGSSKKIPKESIFIYDEAQRAWDREKVLAFRGHNKSEPDDFLEIGSKKDWCVMVGLIGEGQEIHLGEESGISQWNEAINNSGISWKVSCPSHLKGFFTNGEVSENSSLNLTESLRSHLATNVQGLVNGILEGQDSLVIGKNLNSIKESQYDFYLTRDLEKAKIYLKSRYEDEPEKRYGILASSKANILPKYTVMNDFMSTKLVRKGPWYIDDKDSPKSCCQLNEVMTEFGCQGLELDFPIVCWGNDLDRKSVV